MRSQPVQRDVALARLATGQPHSEPPDDVHLMAASLMVEPHVCAPIDANGNLASDGTRTFEWDARNQLLAVNVGTHRSEFTYDGLQRRIRVIEKENSVVQSDTKVLWCEMIICEERASDETTVNRRALRHGEQVGSASRFLVTDHLNSVTAVADASATVLSRYAYDPWGRRTLVSGANLIDAAITLSGNAEQLAMALYSWHSQQVPEADPADDILH